MAVDRQTLIDRPMRRFKGVTNFNIADAEEIVDEAIEANYDEGSAIVRVVFAQWQAAWQVAISVGHYFRFSDGEEEVDKSMIADNYRKLVKVLQNDYDRRQGKVYGGNFRIMKRIDRPYTTPPTGESGRRLWRRY